MKSPGHLPEVIDSVDVSRMHRTLFLSMLMLIFTISIQPGDCSDNNSGEIVADADLEYLDYLLDMKVTSGSFLDLNFEKSPVSMTIIPREEIEVSGARTMSELLEIFVPGFQYMFNKWNGTLWGMRGVTNDRNTKIIYLINGHKMNTQARDGFQGENVLGLMGDVERVEVLRGPAGLVYGSGAISGVVNVVTRKEKGDGSTMRTRIGTYGSQEVDIDINTAPGEDHIFSFTAGFRRSDGLDTRQSRIYGFGSWPFPSVQPVETGVPSDGNYGLTDGNWKVAGEWAYKNFDCYFRLTRQNESAGCWFILDPWPEINSVPDSSAEDRLIDGKTVSPADSFWILTESSGNSRRQYVIDNVLAKGEFSIPLGLNEVQFNLAFDGNTTRIVTERRNGYENDALPRDINYIDNSFGEKRVTCNGVFHLNSVTRLQVAVGMEYRFDAIGKDLEGINWSAGDPRRMIVSDVQYHTYSLFGEGLYEINKRFDAHLGGRLDFHTRAFMPNAKAALIYHPKEQHAVKLICQSSSNNGSADNYEYNRFHIDNEGNLLDKSRFVSFNSQSFANEIFQPAPPVDSLHNLKPEKVYSAELAYTGIVMENLTLAPSVSVGYVKDLFGWSQKLFRVINAGDYKYFNLDLDLNYKRKNFTFGSNHTFQRPIGTDVEQEKRTYKIFTLNTDGPFYDSQIVDGEITYTPIVSDSMADFDVNLVKDGITADGRNFLNLNTHVTKLYCTIRPFEWMTLHTNVRLFWGLPGRRDIYEQDAGFNYWHIADGREELGFVDYLKMGVSKKVNANIHFALPHNFEVGLFAYDILGIDRPTDPALRNFTINTLRWQQMYQSPAKDLYSTDQRTFYFEIKKYF